jgi:hypothetical protein
MNDAETPETAEALAVETTPSSHILWFAVLAALVATGVWATVAMAAGGSGSSGTGNSSPPAAYAPYAADDGTAADDCPNMGGGSGGLAPTAPSQQDGSSNPTL